MGRVFPARPGIWGRWIQYGGWYPNLSVRLAHREHARWTEPLVHEGLEIKGRIRRLDGDLFHYTFQNVGDQVQTNIRFARLGAQVALERGERGSLLKILYKPIVKFIESYFWKLGILDGFPGFVISVNAAHSLFMKYVGIRCGQNSRYR